VRLIIKIISSFDTQPFPFQDAAAQLGYGPNGLNPQAVESMSPDLLAAVRQQMCNMVDAANFVAGFNLPPNMTMQSIAPNLSGNSSNNIPNPKVGSPAALQQLNKNGGESSNALQFPRLGSPALQNLPAELSLQGLQNLSPNDEMDFHKKDKRVRKSEDEELEEQQKSLSNRLSITKMGSSKTPSLESLEPAVNLAISSQTLDMSYNKSRSSNDGSSNGDDMSRSFRNASLAAFKGSTSPIKLEPLADCRE
jgi:hypothetical protein